MVQGLDTHLSRKDQLVIATWVYKTCLILSLGNPSRIRIDQAYLDLFHAHIPSMRNRIAVGGFVGHDKLTTVFHFQPMAIVTKNQVNDILNTSDVYVMTLAIGRFVGQVVHTEFPERFMIKGNSLHEVWPYENDFTWPPLPLFTAEGLQQLALTEHPWLDTPPQDSGLKWTDV